MANSISNLDPVFTNLINNLMVLEQQPLTRLTQQKDDLAIKRAVYVDLKSRLDALKSSVSALKSSDPFFNFAPGRKVSFNSIETGFTVASAAVSTSAVPGEYKITNISLAKEHRIKSDPQLNSDQALGLAPGTILIGGLASRAVAAESSNSTISTFSASNLDVGQQELGSGNYYVETQLSGEVKQFRVVDSNGTAVSIKASSGTTYTSGWQTLPAAGTYNTGRGLSFNISADFVSGTKASGAASISYTAQGASIAITAADSLNDITSKINNASYAVGQGVKATIVDKQLILSAQESGSAHTVIASGDALKTLGILNDLNGFKNQMQIGLNSSFYVNDLLVTRNSNTGLSDVISGVTLNLASDAQGKSATMLISGDTTPQKATLTDFLTKFNTLTSFISQKAGVTKNADGTYTRGSLSSDNAISTLRYDLFRITGGNVSNNGIYKKLSDIGVTITDSMNAVLTDTGKLEKALASNPNEVKYLLDGLMTTLQNKLNNYVGTKSYVEQSIKATENQTKSTEDLIKSMQARLDMRQQNLINQFTDAQNQIQAMAYTRQTLTSIYGSINTSG
jgi:flagellar hook-associated protein 2